MVLPLGSDSAWALDAWSDEFTGSAVDGTRWDQRTGNGGNELSHVQPANNTVAGGQLTIEGKQEAADGRLYTSGYLTSKKAWTYAFFEMSATMPTQANTSKGFWPAFWARPLDLGLGELDIVECIGSGPGSTEWQKTHHTLHHDENTPPAYPHVGRTYTLPGGGTTAARHVYGCEWAASLIRFFVDGVMVFEANPSNVPWIGDAFNGRPFQLRVNLQIGGSWPGSPDSTTVFPGDYVVDYVRVWQRTDGSGSSTSSGGPTDGGGGGGGGVVIVPSSGGSRAYGATRPPLAWRQNTP